MLMLNGCIKHNNFVILLLWALNFLSCSSFKTHRNFLTLQRNAWRAPDTDTVHAHSRSNIISSTPVILQPHHSLYTDASGSIGGGYYLKDQSYSQFRWSHKEKNMYAEAGQDRYTDIRILEFVTAVMAVYTERERLRDSRVELYIDNNGACKWLKNRKMNHLWGNGWMNLLQTVCKEFNIDIRPVWIHGCDNPVADALSRYKTHECNGVDLSMLGGTTSMRSAGSKWRGRFWTKRTHFPPVSRSEERLYLKGSLKL